MQQAKYFPDNPTNSSGPYYDISKISFEQVCPPVHTAYPSVQNGMKIPKNA